ncbi:MAG: gliding motility lipoprotein GldH [Bacteroidales bacterium]
MRSQAGKLILWMIAILGIVWSCQNQTVFDQNIHVNPKGWNKDEIARFDIPIEDTLSFYSVNMFLRNDNNYSYQNIYFFMDIVSPEKKIQRDTIEIILADLKGRWLGTGFGAVKESDILLNSKVRFPHSGVYTFQFTQAMRDDNLAGINDIGLKVAKSK